MPCRLRFAFLLLAILCVPRLAVAQQDCPATPDGARCFEPGSACGNGAGRCGLVRTVQLFLLVDLRLRMSRRANFNECPTATPAPTAGTAPATAKKIDWDSVGSNTAGGAGGAALVNAATGVGELTLGLAILASGFLGAVGTGVATTVYYLGRLLVDPPDVVRPVSEWWQWWVAIALAIVLLAGTGTRASCRFVRAVCFSIAIGGFVGLVTGFNLVEQDVFNAVALMTGFVIGIVDVLVFRSSASISLE